MIQFALGDPDWEKGLSRWRDGADMVNELLGFSMGKAVLGEKVNFTQPVSRLAPIYELAASRWFGVPRVAAAFGRFALTPAGAGLVLPGIRWLASAEPGWYESAWQDDRLAEVLVEVLGMALERHRGAIAADEGLRQPFFTLCHRLVARGYHAALTLRERVAIPTVNESTSESRGH